MCASLVGDDSVNTLLIVNFILSLLGYVMDTYCIERGRLLDRPDIETLEEPDQHSVHCLVDVPQCRNSGFELLLDPVAPDKTHCRAYILDDTGNGLVIEHARLVGDCQTCGSSGMQDKGYRATVTGTISDTAGKNPVLSVTSVEDSSVGCPGGATVPSPEHLDCSSGEDQNWAVIHGSLMLASWGILLPTGVIMARLFKHKKPDGVWFKIHKTLQMSGLLLALAGWTIALVRFDVFSAGIKDNSSYVHGLVGSLVMSLGLLQPFNAFIRPHAPAADDPAPKSGTRVAWEYVHKGSGYAAVVLSLLAIAIGTTLPPRSEDQIAFQIVYLLVLVCLVSLIAVLWLDRRNFQRSVGAKKESMPL